MKLNQSMLKILRIQFLTILCMNRILWGLSKLLKEIDNRTIKRFIIRELKNGKN